MCSTPYGALERLLSERKIALGRSSGTRLRRQDALAPLLLEVLDHMQCHCHLSLHRGRNLGLQEALVIPKRRDLRGARGVFGSRKHTAGDPRNDRERKEVSLMATKQPAVPWRESASRGGQSGHGTRRLPRPWTARRAPAPPRAPRSAPGASRPRGRAPRPAR